MADLCFYYKIMVDKMKNLLGYCGIYFIIIYLIYGIMNKIKNNQSNDSVKKDADNNLAYPDLENSEYVFEALLGYGMFMEKLPQCFVSEDLLEYVKKNGYANLCKNHYYIEYQSTRNTNVPRQMAIPHPESYCCLCKCIKENWENINKHIGKPKKTFSFCHVRKIKDKKHIFEMNYSGEDKWLQEEKILDYSLGCQYVVSADISTCFPSFYSHSIPWALESKEWGKKNRNTAKRKDKKTEQWKNELDKISRSMKDGETNGLLIGPHTSNIISEIILTKIDCELQKDNFEKVIRNIDDYQFFAKDENEAKEFLKKLTAKLKEYELLLNPKKTQIKPYGDYCALN